MNESIIYDYIYGGEAEQFSYYRIPRALVTGTQFKRLSTDAKLLYGLLLDRMSVSARNGWYDALGRVFIYYPLDEISEALNCSHGKAVRLLAELDANKGVGLIERVRQGQGKASRIYVKQFTTKEIPSSPTPPQEEEPQNRPDSGSAESLKTEVQTVQKGKSRCSKNGSLDIPKWNGSYLKYNYLKKSYLNPSINPSKPPQCRTEREAAVKERIGYRLLRERYGHEDADAITGLMTDVLDSTRPTLRIGSEELPTETVRARFWQLGQPHIEYVLDSLRNSTAQIRNIRGYLLAALYRAPVTIGAYRQNTVPRDAAFREPYRPVQYCLP